MEESDKKLAEAHAREHMLPTGNTKDKSDKDEAPPGLHQVV